MRCAGDPIAMGGQRRRRVNDSNTSAAAQTTVARCGRMDRWRAGDATTRTRPRRQKPRRLWRSAAAASIRVAYAMTGPPSAGAPKTDPAAGTSPGRLRTSALSPSVLGRTIPVRCERMARFGAARTSISGPGCSRASDSFPSAVPASVSAACGTTVRSPALATFVSTFRSISRSCRSALGPGTPVGCARTAPSCVGVRTAGARHRSRTGTHRHCVASGSRP